MMKFLLLCNFIMLILSNSACSFIQPKQNSVENKLNIRQLENTKLPKANANDQIHSTGTAQNLEISFQDFKERWNAISEEQLSNITIKNLEETTTTAETFYYAQLRNTIELRVYPNQNKIQKF